jgi:hypothetical protein
MKRKCSTVFVLVSVLAVVLALADEGSKQTATIDLTPAVRIGDFTTSRYLFDKAYNQFMGLNPRGVRPKSDNEMMEHWLRLFLAHQVIKADLAERKQQDRPEVVEMTGRMAQYMLTQPGGPLYRELGGTDRVAFRRARRARILQECQFSASSENIALLWNAIAPELRRGSPLRDKDVTSIAESVLASYSSTGTTKQISALDFVRDFQNGIARMTPRDVKELKEQIEDIVVAEYDLAEAKKLRLDQTPQFLEDRHNFALNQALALYEKEVLSKQLVASPDRLETYRQNNLGRYSSPVEIKGALFIYNDLEGAQREMTISLHKGNGPSLISFFPETIDPFVIHRDAPPIFIEVSYAMLASLPVDRRYGPFAYGGKYAVFLKRANGELAPLPFTLIQDQLRRDLSREKIDAIELAYLSRNLDRIQLSLDASKYKIENILSRFRDENVHATIDRAGTEKKKSMPN